MTLAFGQPNMIGKQYSGPEMTDPSIEWQLYQALCDDGQRKKVASLLMSALTLEDFPTDEIINQALDQLAMRPDIETFGDIHLWRHSEIRRV